MKPKSNKELQAYFVELTNTLERKLINMPQTKSGLKKEIKKLKRRLEDRGIDIPEFSEETIGSFAMFCGE